MVKCISACLLFLKTILSEKPKKSVQKIQHQEIPISNNEALNVTSMNDREIQIEEVPGIKIEANFESQVQHRSSIITGTGVISDNNNVLPLNFNQDVNSELCLSPISKRSFSEDLSPIKIPSPGAKSRAKIIPHIFLMNADGQKMPRIHAATPRVKLPRNCAV